MNEIKSKVLTAGAVLCAIATLALIACDFFFNNTVSSNFWAMSTAVGTAIKGSGAKKADEQIKSEILRLDTQLLSRTALTAQVYKLNSGSEQPSAELTELLGEIKAIEEKSNYAFCAGLGKVTELWGIGTPDAKLPAEDQLKAAAAAARNWQISGGEIILGDALIDLGAVGKGIACDYAEKILEDNGCKRAVVTVGGSVLLYSKNGKETFNIGIRNPRGSANEAAATLSLSNTCVSTSGSYERVFEADGKSYHHIFDSATGYPAQSGLVSVTVICKSGLLSDALSTACFVLGIEKSLPLLAEYNAEAVFITEGNEIVTTPNLEGLEIVNDDFFLGEAK